MGDSCWWIDDSICDEEYSRIRAGAALGVRLAPGHEVNKGFCWMAALLAKALKRI